MRSPLDPRSSRPASAGTTRRGFLAAASAVGFGGLGIVPRSRPNPAADDPKPRAQAVIQIFLGGGLSHVDTFDPKPEAPIEVRGAFRPVETKLDGERFSELCRGSASIADRLVLFRSVTHSEAAHERGTHNMLTGYRPSPAIVYPSFGAVVSHELGLRNDLPPYVCVPRASVGDLGTGYLGAAFGPFSVGGEPSARGFEVRDLEPASALEDVSRERRRRMLAGLDADFAADADAIDSTQAFYEQAWKMIDSPAAREAFRVDREPDALRARYGRSRMGQRLLLARRLVEAGVRFVAIPDGGWDHHRKINDALRQRVPAVDRAFAALITDLDERGLLDSTLVLLTTEFGRTPRINQDAGRDHWPRVFSVVAAGGGLKRGVAHGRSDPSGSEPDSDAVSPGDLAATMFTLLGIDPTRRLMSPGDRPIDIVRDGRVIREVLA